MDSLKSLSDKELTARLRRLVDKEKTMTLAIVVHLAEVERRGLYLEKAYGTLTEYCIQELGYGESSAWRRVRAAKVITRFPEVCDLMRDNQISFSAVLQIANVLGEDNKKELLARVQGKSKSEIDMIITDYQTPLVIPDQARPRLVKREITALRAPSGAFQKSARARASAPELGEISLRCEGKNDPTDKISTPEVEVVLEKMFEIRFAADDELMGLIKWTRSHLSHKYPEGAGFLEIFKYALNDLKQREDLSLQEPPRKTDARTDTRYIPKAIKQKVWKRDGGRCTFVGSDHKRCNSDFNVQFDHHPVPFARGGPSTVSNLRLLCAKHNRYSAEKLYGERTIKKHYLKESGASYLRATMATRVIT